MAEIDRKNKAARGMALARFCKFVETYLYDTDWTLVAAMCGVNDLLDKPQHGRVRNAQYWHDSDYPTAVLSFLTDVFENDEQIGRALISTIVQQRGPLSDKAKSELDPILSILGSKSADIGSLLLAVEIPTLDKFIKVTWLPDDFYVRLVEEINRIYVARIPMALWILIRKLLENLIIDILRKKYSTGNLSLYYDVSRGRFHDFSVLLVNLEGKKEDFRYITPNLDKSLIQKINKYRETGNSGAHSIDVNLSIDEIAKDKDNINYITQLLLRILQNI